MGKTWGKNSTTVGKIDKKLTKSRGWTCIFYVGKVKKCKKIAENGEKCEKSTLQKRGKGGFSREFVESWCKRELSTRGFWWVLSPIHSPDSGDDGQCKKLHCHLFCMLADSRKAMTLEYFESLLDKISPSAEVAVKDKDADGSEVWRLSCVRFAVSSCETVADPVGLCRYFYHLDNQDKEQFDIDSDVIREQMRVCTYDIESAVNCNPEDVRAKCRNTLIKEIIGRECLTISQLVRRHLDDPQMMKAISGFRPLLNDIIYDEKVKMKLEKMAEGVFLGCKLEKLESAEDYAAKAVGAEINNLYDGYMSDNYEGVEADDDIPDVDDAVKIG